MPTLSDLTLTEINALELRFDGPITEQAIADEIAQGHGVPAEFSRIPVAVDASMSHLDAMISEGFRGDHGRRLAGKGVDLATIEHERSAPDGCTDWRWLVRERISIAMHQRGWSTASVQADRWDSVY